MTLTGPAFPLASPRPCPTSPSFGRLHCLPCLVLLVALGCGTRADLPPGSVGASGGTDASGGTTGSGGADGGTPGSGGTQDVGGAPGSGGTTAMALPPCVSAAFTSMNLCGACHATGSATLFGGLDLSGDVLSRILDKPATYGGVSDKTNCKPGALILDTAVPENSVMLKKLTNTQDCGSMMPSGLPISDAEKMCLVDWIRSL